MDQDETKNSRTNVRKCFVFNQTIFLFQEQVDQLYCNFATMFYDAKMTPFLTYQVINFPGCYFKNCSPFRRHFLDIINVRVLSHDRTAYFNLTVA